MPLRKAASRHHLDICKECNCVTTHLARPQTDVLIEDIYRNHAGTAYRLTYEDGQVIWRGCLECIYEAHHAYSQRGQGYPEYDSLSELKARFS